MKKCARLLGLGRDTGQSGSSKRRKEISGSPYPDSESAENSMSVSLTMKPKHGFVRIVHKGGREELYHHEVLALDLMEKYPGTRVAKPEIFKSPHDSVLWPEEKLFLGHKYLIIPSTAVRKLQQKRPEKSESSEWENVIMELAEMDFEDSVSSAKEFYVSKERSPKGLLVKGMRKKKPFVPPLPKTRSYRGLAWEPSLASVQELSP